MCIHKKLFTHIYIYIIFHIYIYIYVYCMYSDTHDICTFYLYKSHMQSHAHTIDDQIFIHIHMIYIYIYVLSTCINHACNPMRILLMTKQRIAGTKKTGEKHRSSGGIPNSHKWKHRQLTSTIDNTRCSIFVDGK